MNGPELDHLLSDRHLDELVTTFRRLTGAQESAACVCVLIDPLLLATLPKRELRAGLAEVVKYGAIGDGAFFSWL